MDQQLGDSAKMTWAEFRNALKQLPRIRRWISGEHPHELIAKANALSDMTPQQAFKAVSNGWMSREEFKEIREYQKSKGKKLNKYEKLQMMAEMGGGKKSGPEAATFKKK